MTNVVDVGTVSARGQVAIPTDIRDKMGLKEGEKILFVLENDTLLVKKVSALPWAEVTRPLREAKKRISEDEVVRLVHKIRKAK